MGSLGEDINQLAISIASSDVELSALTAILREEAKDHSKTLAQCWTCCSRWSEHVHHSERWSRICYGRCRSFPPPTSRSWARWFRAGWEAVRMMVSCPLLLQEFNSCFIVDVRRPRRSCINRITPNRTQPTTFPCSSSLFRTRWCRRTWSLRRQGRDRTEITTFLEGGKANPVVAPAKFGSRSGVRGSKQEGFAYRWLLIGNFPSGRLLRS